MSTEQQMGRLIQSVDDLRDGMARIEMAVNTRFGKIDEEIKGQDDRLRDTEIQQGKMQGRFKGSMWVISAILIPILGLVIKLAFL